jgi:hypothetical protein
VNRIKAIVNLWFDPGEEAKCQELYPACEGCPFYFQPDPEEADMACKTMWSLIEHAAANL